jgi:hypothetical protein
LHENAKNVILRKYFNINKNGIIGKINGK